MDEKRLTVTKKECSDQSSSDKPVVTAYSDSYSSDSDEPSEVLYSVVTLYSVVMNSDLLYSSDRGGSLYSVVIRES